MIRLPFPSAPAAFVLGLALASVGAGSIPRAGAGEAAMPTEWLSIQTATASSFDGEVLRLENVSPRTMQFADRPVRLAVDTPTPEFVRAWSSGANSFAADPPNAGLTIVNDGAISMATVELYDPSLDGDVLAYRIRVIEGEVPAQGGATSLFIDEAGRDHIIIR